MRTIRSSVLLGLSGLVLLVSASCVSVRAATLELTYRAYAAGFATLDFTVTLDLAPDRYGITLAYRTVGPAGFLFPGHATVTAQGTWTDDGAAPRSFASQARWRGRSYDVLIDYPEGAPLVERLVPSETKRREPVPAAQRRNTIDTASAIALLLDRMAKDGQCRFAVRVFDGRRLMELRAHPAGTADLGVTERSFFHGSAERCDVTGKMLAGFLRSDGSAERRRLTHGVAWFAHPAAGYPLLPVKIAFPGHWFGTSLAYLTAVKTLPTPPPQKPRHLAFAPPRGEPPPGGPGVR